MEEKHNAVLYRMNIRIDKFAPQQVLDLVAMMVERGNKICNSERRFLHKPRALPNHPFFTVEGWFNLLRNTTPLKKRFVSHVTTGGLLRYISGRVWLLEEEKHLVLRAVGISPLEEQDFALFLHWLMPYIERPTESDNWLAMAQSVHMHATGVNLRKNLSGYIKCYYHPHMGLYPRLVVKKGSVTAHPAHIL